MIREIGGAVDSCGESTLELTEEEVDSLVELIERKRTADMEELELEVPFPEVYAKLDNAYREAALDADEYHWLECGWENPDVFSPYDHIEFGEKELGYKSLNTTREIILKTQRSKTLGNGSTLTKTLSAERKVWN